MISIIVLLIQPVSITIIYFCRTTKDQVWTVGNVYGLLHQNFDNNKTQIQRHYTFILLNNKSTTHKGYSLVSFHSELQLSFLSLLQTYFCVVSYLSVCYITSLLGVLFIGYIVHVIAYVNVLTAVNTNAYSHLISRTSFIFHMTRLLLPSLFICVAYLISCNSFIAHLS